MIFKTIFSCAGTDNDDVLFLHNERPLVIPGCLPTGVCKVRDIVARYSRFVNANCDVLRCSTM
jgi:hypothetical protein